MTIFNKPILYFYNPLTSTIDVDPGHPSIHAVIVRVLKTQYNEEVNKSDQDSDDGKVSS